MKVQDAYQRVVRVLDAFDVEPKYLRPTLDSKYTLWHSKPSYPGVSVSRHNKRKPDLRIGLCGGCPTLELLSMLACAFHVSLKDVEVQATHRVNICTEYTYDADTFIELTLKGVR